MRFGASLLYRIVRIWPGDGEPTTQRVDRRDLTELNTNGCLIRQARCIPMLRNHVASGENCVQSPCTERPICRRSQANTLLQRVFRSNNPMRTALPDGKVVLSLAKDRLKGADWEKARSQGAFYARRPPRCKAPVPILGILAHARRRLFTPFLMVVSFLWRSHS